MDSRKASPKLRGGVYSAGRQTARSQKAVSAVTSMKGTYGAGIARTYYSDLCLQIRRSCTQPYWGDTC